MGGFIPGMPGIPLGTRGPPGVHARRCPSDTRTPCGYPGYPGYPPPHDIPGIPGLARNRIRVDLLKKAHTRANQGTELIFGHSPAEELRLVLLAALLASAVARLRGGASLSAEDRPALLSATFSPDTIEKEPQLVPPRLAGRRAALAYGKMSTDFACFCVDEPGPCSPFRPFRPFCRQGCQHVSWRPRGAQGCSEPRGGRSHAW